MGKYRVYMEGVALFLFIPLTLFIMLVFPLGILLSLLTAIALIGSHRFIARPYMMKNKEHKCLWCNMIPEKMVHSTIIVKEGQKELTFNACQEKCQQEIIKFFSFTGNYGQWIKWCIIIPLFLYIVGSLLLLSGFYHWDIKWNKVFFKGIIAFCVIVISIVYKIKTKSKELSFPLPIHNLLLLGIRNTLWIFRIVGVWWLYTVFKDIM